MDVFFEFSWWTSPDALRREGTRLVVHSRVYPIFPLQVSVFMRTFICLDIPESHEDRDKPLLFCRTVVNTKYDMTKFSNKR